VAGEWRSLRLGSMCSKIGSGATPRGGSNVYLDHGRVTLIRSQNVYNDGFHRDGLTYITEEHAAELSNVEVLEGDILLNITGDSVARSCQVDSTVLPARVNQHVTIIRPNPNRLWPRFLRYSLVSPRMQAHMLSLAGSGGTRNALTKGMIEGFEILAPEDVTQQRAIACILGALDDKIELNRRMNETLEGIAQAIFKSWFVDATRDGLPEGWREVPLPEVIELNPSRTLRKGEVAPYLDMANMPTVGHSPDSWVMREVGSGMKFINGDTLVARITPCLENGKTAYVDFLADEQVGWGSTEYIILRPKGKTPPIFAYLLARTDEFRTFAIQQMTGSSGRQRVPTSSLEKYRIVVPDQNSALFENFGKAVSPLFDRMKGATAQSRTLSGLRDALLPKLVSGELRVPDAERICARGASAFGGVGRCA